MTVYVHIYGATASGKTRLRNFISEAIRADHAKGTGRSTPASVSIMQGDHVERIEAPPMPFLRGCCVSYADEAHRAACPERIFGTTNPRDTEADIRESHRMWTHTRPAGGARKWDGPGVGIPPRVRPDRTIWPVLTPDEVKVIKRVGIWDDSEPPRDLGHFNCRGDYVYDGPTIHLAPGDIDADGYVIGEEAKAFVRSLGLEPAVRPHRYASNKPGARR